MKQFNLQEYLENPSLSIITRDGKPVRILCTDAMSEYPIIALVKDYDKEYMKSYTQDGTFGHGKQNPCDLLFATTKHEGFVNIYRSNNEYITRDVVHNTEEEAKRFIFPNSGYITTIRVGWEE